MTTKTFPQQATIGRTQVRVTVLDERTWHGEQQYLCRLNTRVHLCDDEPVWQWANTVTFMEA